MAIAATTTVRQDATALIESMRSAVGVDALGNVGPEFSLVGTIELHGVECDFRLSLDQAGRIVRNVDGALSETQAFDGRAGWRRDMTGMPATIAMGDLEHVQLESWVMSGLWLARPGLLEVRDTSLSEDGSQATLKIRVVGGQVEARLVVDTSTALTVSLSVPSAGGEVITTLNDYGDAGGYRFPRHMHRTLAELTSETVELRACVPSSTPLEQSLLRPPAPEDTDFSAASGSVETGIAPTGHLLVRLRIDGQDVPRFIFDTGAGHSVISSVLRARLDLPKVGHSPLVSMFGAAMADIFRAKEIEFGPLKLQQPYFVEMDLAMLEQYMGEPIGGVIGFDVLSRAVLDIDAAAPSIEVHNPRVYDSSGMDWVKILFNGGHPHLPASFAGGTGIFRLDLGAAGGPHGNVIFHARAVRQFDLLASQDTSQKQQIGENEVVIGTIDWFELEGKRFDKTEVAFATGDTGLFASDPYAAGNIGVGLLGQFRIVLQFAKDRVALIKKP